MARITVHHRTRPANLPSIEVSGLRTRAERTRVLGPLDAFDRAASGRLANGRRVSGWVSRGFADTQSEALGAGLVSYTVDPARVIALRTSERVADPSGAWSGARTLSAWLAEVGSVEALPDDLEVHQDQPVRAKLVTMLAPTFTDAALGDLAPLVAAVADQDRLGAKLLVHLLLAASGGDADDANFLAACALAWRDVADVDELAARVARADVEAVLEAVLAEQERAAPAAVGRLLALMAALREEGEGLGQGVDAVVLERSDRALALILAGVSPGGSGSASASAG
jgi:hypothetical protein